MAKVAIIGAGLTSLSLAYNLEKSGFSDYQIFEQDSRPGGLLKSHVANGFVFDHTGHFLHISKPEFAQFLNATIGLDFMNKLNRQSFIFSHNSFTPYPFQKNLCGLPNEVIIDCIVGFVERQQKLKNPRNFYQWVLKHFGSGLGKHFFFPYNSKLLNITPQKLMPSWTSRFVPSTTLAELLDGALQRHDVSTDGYNASFFYPQNGGIESLVHAITKNITKPILCNKKVVAVDVANKKMLFADATSANFDLLFSTMPLPVLLRSCKQQTKNNWAALAEKLHCNKVLNFNLGIKQPNISEKHWVYFPEKDFSLYRLGFWHNFAASMAPTGFSSCYGEVSVKPTLGQKAQQNLVAKAIEQTLQFLHLTPQDVAEQCVLQLPYAYVTYDAWREKNLHKLHAQLQQNDIHSIGRFGEWKYSSMQEAFFDGQNAAKTVWQRYCVNKQGENILWKTCSI